MADHARPLIVKIIETRDIQSAISRGVAPGMFRTYDDKQAWDFISKNYVKHGVVPSLTAVRKNFPAQKFPRVTDEYDFLVDQFLQDHRNRTLGKVVEDVVDAVQSPTAWGRVEDVLRSGVATLDKLTASSTADSNLRVNEAERRGYYGGISSTNGMLGVPTGFPTIDLATAGLQPGQLVTIVASPKTGKSSLALRVAQNVCMAGDPVLFQTFEMSQKEQWARFDSLGAQISLSRLTRGTLHSDERKRLDGFLTTPLSADFIISDSRSVSTVSTLAAKVGSLATKPELVVVDGVYFMTDEVTGERNTSQALTNITRSLKALAQRLDLAILATTQALLSKMSKSRLNADSIGYSSSFLQDSDVILGLERVGEDTPDQRLLRVVESRNCGPVEVNVDWLWEAGVIAEEGTVNVP